MDKELQDNYSLDFAQQALILRSHQRQQEEGLENGVEMVDYMLSNCNEPPPQHHLSFADVMHFADFGPKLALNQANKTPTDDDSYFFKFNFMSTNNKIQEGGPSSLPPPPPPQTQIMEDGEEEERGQFSKNASSVQQQQLGFGGGGGDQGENIGGGGGGGGGSGTMEVKNRRKRSRSRSMKTSEEVETQRMTHIAVERNRRRQMNEHLRVLRSLMPGSYFQRGDQASIIGGAIEFVRELEQLLQCLESQKRRRLFGGAEPPPPRIMADAPPLPLPIQQTQQQPPFFSPLPLPCCGGDNNMTMLDLDTSSNIHEDMAENKSSLADVEVRVLGFDAMIKILSRRSSGQLIKTIAALEDLQFNILQTNITTIEQTVLYSFNVKIAGEASCTAEDIANSVQQTLCFTDTSTI